MKWKIASISLVLMTLLVLLSAMMMKQFPGQQTKLFTRELRAEDLQLGYYDLLSRKRELYDSSFITQDDKVSMTLTSPNDNRIGIKVNLLQKNASASRLTFDFIPIYYSDNNRQQMVKNILGYGWQKQVVFDPLTVEGEQLVVMPSGQILSAR